MLRYRINILEALSKAGYSVYKLQKEKIIGKKSIQDLKDGKVVGIITLERICGLLHCQPGDLIEYVDAKKEEGA